MAADTVYLKIEQNVLVREPSVTLKDIAKITSTNRLLVNKLKQIKIYTFHTPANKSRKKKQVEVFSVLKIIELIGQEFPSVEIQNIGEKDFVLEYAPMDEIMWVQYLKTAILCVLVFFGSAFTIMTFDNDVGVGRSLQTSISRSWARSPTALLCWRSAIPSGCSWAL